jgi:hypothetical protein
VYIGDRIVDSTRSGRVRADSARGLHVAANISELFRSLEESSLAELPFLVGCGRITQTIDFLACQFRRFRSFVSSGPRPLSTREPQLHKPTDGFGAARLIGLTCRPGVHIFTHFGRKSNGRYGVLARCRSPPLFSYYVFPRALHYFRTTLIGAHMASEPLAGIGSRVRPRELAPLGPNTGAGGPGSGMSPGAFRVASIPCSSSWRTPAGQTRELPRSRGCGCASVAAHRPKSSARV